MMHIKVALFVSLLGYVAPNRFSYHGYEVLKVSPKDEFQMKTLMNYYGKPEFDFWTVPRRIEALDIMVAPSHVLSFKNLLRNYDINFVTLIDNVEGTILAQDDELSKKTRTVNGSANFTNFMTYEEIVSYLQTLATDYPELVTLETIGKTLESRDIIAAKISTGGSNKPAILVEAAIHAREWIAPPVALYILNQLIENPQNSALIENVDWFVIPVMNPDGYVYTHSTERLWRKNRQPGTKCDGVDLNRNFDFHWMETGASDDECSNIYAGTVGFSELESQTLRDFVNANSEAIKLYLTLHSYGQYILYPWGYTSDLPDDWETLDALGHEVNKAIESVNGTSYVIGTSTNLLGTAAGCSDDWVKGPGGVNLSFVLELPGGGSHGFNPPASSILPIVLETWEGVKVYHKYTEDNFV